MAWRRYSSGTTPFTGWSFFSLSLRCRSWDATTAGTEAVWSPGLGSRGSRVRRREVFGLCSLSAWVVEFIAGIYVISTWPMYESVLTKDRTFGWADTLIQYVLLSSRRTARFYSLFVRLFSYHLSLEEPFESEKIWWLPYCWHARWYSWSSKGRGRESMQILKYYKYY